MIKEFFDVLTTTADAQGYAEVRRELVGDLTERVLEIGCGTGNMFASVLPAFPMRRVHAHKGGTAPAL